MEIKKYTGKSIEEALERALNEMMMTRDDIGYRVVSQPSKGFLGFGSKDAVVEVWKKSDYEEASIDACVCDIPQEELKAEDEEFVFVDTSRAQKQDRPRQGLEETSGQEEEEDEEETTTSKKPENENAEQIGRDFLKKIFEEMKLDVSVETEKKSGYLTFRLVGDGLGILIGHRGETLDAIQFLLNLVINDKEHAKIKAIINVENYREKREKTLVNLARKMASKAVHSGQKIVMEPMNPQERRIIHMALQNDNRVTTYSEGEEPHRKVIIAPERKQRNK